MKLKADALSRATEEAMLSPLLLHFSYCEAPFSYITTRQQAKQIIVETKFLGNPMLSNAEMLSQIESDARSFLERRAKSTACGGKHDGIVLDKKKDRDDFSDHRSLEWVGEHH